MVVTIGKPSTLYDDQQTIAIAIVLYIACVIYNFICVDRLGKIGKQQEHKA